MFPNELEMAYVMHAMRTFLHHINFKHHKILLSFPPSPPPSLDSYHSNGKMLWTSLPPLKCQFTNVLIQVLIPLAFGIYKIYNEL